VLAARQGCIGSRLLLSHCLRRAGGCCAWPGAAAAAPTGAAPACACSSSEKMRLSGVRAWQRASSRPSQCMLWPAVPALA
jgi:hypothetical protein